MKNSQFLDELERRAGEGRRGKNGGIVDTVVGSVAGWVGVEPWRVMVPLAILMSLIAVVLLRSWVVGVVSMVQWGF